MPTIRTGRYIDTVTREVQAAKWTGDNLAEMCMLFGGDYTVQCEPEDPERKLVFFARNSFVGIFATCGISKNFIKPNTWIVRGSDGRLEGVPDDAFQKRCVAA